jgi:hypothetical protein
LIINKRNLNISEIRERDNYDTLFILLKRGKFGKEKAK